MVLLMSYFKIFIISFILKTDKFFKPNHQCLYVVCLYFHFFQQKIFSLMIFLKFLVYFLPKLFLFQQQRIFSDLIFFIKPVEYIIHVKMGRTPYNRRTGNIYMSFTLLFIFILVYSPYYVSSRISKGYYFSIIQFNLNKFVDQIRNIFQIAFKCAPLCFFFSFYTFQAWYQQIYKPTKIIAQIILDL
ncbi:hypothetical protein IMG5_162720 [Ichthyophthirius multifiliis]|uniref:Transmembrane protein n=1 Tax=Ichthyophthirius multifiliis TaxID=5932 RepID=G0R090_ICHMU|nr:hypothetical protein IMG5_162720 [Ichthyophthirius multifiliis]EGR29098.1 hypothetical protein IMG5_162720 [Ichthyophthirius multifiliis]|eukprot:XP_004030334.1 hypothetical protein IMG5_162720 [Ichthyophthirius multifiliis]